MSLTLYKFSKRTNSTKSPDVHSADATKSFSEPGFEVSSSLTNPKVIISNNESWNVLAGKYNYFKIEMGTGTSKFKKFYFITDMIALPDGRVEIHGTEDVLATYRSDLFTAYNKFNITRTNNLGGLKATAIRNSKINIPVQPFRFAKRIKKIGITPEFPKWMDPNNHALGKYPYNTLDTNGQLINPGFTSEDGCFIIGIVMNEVDSSQEGYNILGHPHASINKGGVGYYAFSNVGGSALMQRLQAEASGNSDINLQSKIACIYYVPIRLESMPQYYPADHSDQMLFEVVQTQVSPRHGDVITVPQFMTINNVEYQLWTKLKLTFNLVYAALTNPQGSLYKWSPVLNPTTDCDEWWANSTTPFTSSSSASDIKAAAPDQMNYEPFTQAVIHYGPWGDLQVPLNDLLQTDPKYGSVTTYSYLMLMLDITTGQATLNLIRNDVTTSGGVETSHDRILVKKTIQLCPQIAFYGLSSMSRTTASLIETFMAFGVYNGVLNGVSSGLKNLTGGVAGWAGLDNQQALDFTTINLNEEADWEYAAPDRGMFGGGANYNRAAGGIFGGAMQAAAADAKGRAALDKLAVQQGYKVGNSQGTILDLESTLTTDYCMELTYYLLPNIIMDMIGNTDPIYILDVNVYLPGNDVLSTFGGKFIACDNVEFGSSNTVLWANFTELNQIMAMLKKGIYVE